MPYFGYRGWGGCKIVFLWENLFLNHRPSTVVHIQHCANFFWLPWNNRNGYLWKRASICGNITMWISDTVHRVIRSILAATSFVFWAFGGSEVAFCRWCGSVGFIRWWARACPGVGSSHCKSWANYCPRCLGSLERAVGDWQMNCGDGSSDVDTGPVCRGDKRIEY